MKQEKLCNIFPAVFEHFSKDKNSVQHILHFGSMTQNSAFSTGSIRSNYKKFGLVLRVVKFSIGI